VIATVGAMAIMLDRRKSEASYDSSSMSHVEVKRYRPSERAAVKQLARDEQARALARGERSAADLHRENGLLAFSRQRVAVDFSGFINAGR
jgi:hypothetical protein